jgi:hypothetical protein
MSLLSASQAREMMPHARANKVEKAIRFAIKEGETTCFVRFRCTEGELRMWEDLGYNVRTCSSGSTFFSWNKEVV